jgi:hypothetical protein
VTNDEPPSASVKIVEILEDGNGQAGGHTEDTREETVSETPVPLMQRVGAELGIDPIKITEGGEA